jgi:hypothetical protein
MGGQGAQLRRRTLLVASVLAMLIATPAIADADPFCETSVVRNYRKPLEGMPPLHSSPLGERLSFGPRNVFFGRTGPWPLVVGSAEIGFHLSYASITKHNTGPPLHWLVTAKLAQVDLSGLVRDVIDWKRVDGLELSDRISFSFQPPSKPALYRIEVVFRNKSRKKLGRFGEYFRVMRPTLDAGLSLNGASFRPGETVSARLENYGTEALSYGLHYSIEAFDGSAWARSPISPSGPVVAIGLATGPGEAASCWDFRIPPDAPPGLYRFVWSGESYRNRFTGFRPLTLTAEFQIAPAG